MVVFAHYPASEVRVQREAEALIRNGYEVDIICLRNLASGREPSFEVSGGVSVYRAPATRSYGRVGYLQYLAHYLRFFFWAMFTLIRLYPRRHYRVVQVHNLPDFLIFAAWFPRLFGASLILDLHDLMPEFFAERTGHGFKSWLVRLVRWQEQLSCRFAHHVVTVTELWRQALIQRGVPPEKVSVVMNVPDDRVFFRRDCPDSVGERDGFCLLYHGALAQRHGVDLLLEAVGRLKDEVPGLHLMIHSGGTREYKETLVQMVSQLGIADRVTFHDSLMPVAELPQLICTADVGVVPYRRGVFTDGILPTKLMEYAALVVPAVVARTPAVEAHFDHTMVEFFQPGNVDDLARAIRVLYADPERRKMLARNAVKFSERYNWTRLSAEYVELVERLGNSHGRAG